MWYVSKHRFRRPTEQALFLTAIANLHRREIVDAARIQLLMRMGLLGLGIELCIEDRRSRFALSITRIAKHADGHV